MRSRTPAPLSAARTALGLLFLALLCRAAGAQGASGLVANGAALCIPNGGFVGLDLDAGGAHAGQLFLVLGSASGTAPGLLLDGKLLPLTPDAYFNLSLAQANNPALFPGTLGFLDGLGRAGAGIALPTEDKLIQLVGLKLDFAYLVADLATNTVAFTSNSARVTLTAGPGAGFAATSPTSGAPPLQVSFSNTTQGTATSFLWEFGDGTTSTSTSPTKTYSQPGTYTVKLTATGPCGTSAVSQVGLVQVAPTFASVYAVFQTGNQCLNCHQGAFPSGGLGFDSKALAYSSLVGVQAACSPGEKRVLAFDPAGSLLVKKLREATFGTPDACGLPMPYLGLPGSALSPSNVAKIEAWIASGAPNN